MPPVVVTEPLSQLAAPRPIGGQRPPLTLERIRTKQIRVGVVGLGYVGLPLSMSFASKGVRVVGLDVDPTKISAVNRGVSYVDGVASEQLADVVGRRLLMATDDYSEVAGCDAILICVPTPLTEHLEPDLQYVIQTCEAVSRHLQPYTLVVLESTTYPGTTDEVVAPIMERGSGLSVGEGLFLCFSPEREDPGNKKFSTSSIPKLVGGINRESLLLGEALYGLAIDQVVALSSTKVAESAKLLENIFRSVNIALVNELKVILHKMGIDIWEVIEAASSKPFGYMPFWPGPGLGGHCIPVDPFYLTWKAKEFGVRTRFIELAGEINRSMPLWVLQKIQDLLNQYGKPIKGSHINILGLTYKPRVADIRESPSLELIALLKEKGALVDYCDPCVGEIPQTRRYRALQGMKSRWPGEECDCLVLATAHDCFDAEKLLQLNVPIVDTRNHFPKHELVSQA